MSTDKSKGKRTRAEPAKAHGRDVLYLVFIFLTGAITLAMELLASRVLTPYFGVSLFIWSGILSITLIALALGYYAGGRVTQTPREQRRFSLDFLFLLMPTISGIAIAASCLLYPKIFYTLGSTNLVMGAYAACMLLIFSPLVAVSSMNPLLIAIQSEKRNRGGDSGSGLVFFVSTVGSVIGVSLTAFLFIPNVTNFNSLLILGVTLSTISLIGGLTSTGLGPGEKNRLLGISAIGVAISLGLLSYSSSYLKKNEPIAFGNGRWTLEREYTSLFGNTKIVTIAPAAGTPEAELIEKYGTLYYTDGITMNIIDPNGRSLTPFTYALEFLANGLRPDAERALMLGLGAGIIPMQLAQRGVDVDVVEIDPSSIAAAEDYFGFDPTRVDVIQTDARTYVRDCEDSYDVVLIDMSHGDGLPEYLLSREFFLDIRRCLTRDGIAVFNTFAATEHLDAYYHIVKTVQAVFPELLMYHDGFEDGKRAISIYLAALQGPADGNFEIPIETVPKGIAHTIERVFAQTRPLDASLLAQAEILEDEFNRFSFLNLKSDQFFRESVLLTLPREFLVN
ncbi:MAG: fused MFS/spermidine synthase [Deltaproteobacteria bacterium]|nr:fused MFS/spermidine synthase [Deltaproteobacteria bacterium]